MTLPSLEHDTTMDGIFRQRCPPKCCRSTGMTNIQDEATRKLLVRFCNNYGSRQGGKTSAQKGPVGGPGGNMACDMKNFTHRKGRLPSSAQLINRFVQLLKDTCDIQELPRVVSFPTNPGSMMSVKFLIALRWKH